jgi:hypothetical protein
MYMGVKVKFHAFLLSALDGEMVIFRLRQLYPRRKSLTYPLTCITNIYVYSMSQYKFNISNYNDS